MGTNIGSLVKTKGVEMKNLMVLGVLLMGSLSFASGPWGAEELRTAGDSAFPAFKAKLGDAAYANITEYRVKLSTQKNSARVYVTYTSGAEELIEKFFCHNHGDEIDCH